EKTARAIRKAVRQAREAERLAAREQLASEEEEASEEESHEMAENLNNQPQPRRTLGDYGQRNN
ncbi:hypothetical protein A2U01_0118691, partial [Trifolium medium]|nr:hypothetical protein [Trifolium medium]